MRIAHKLDVGSSVVDEKGANCLDHQLTKLRVGLVIDSRFSAGEMVFFTSFRISWARRSFVCPQSAVTASNSLKVETSENPFGIYSVCLNGTPRWSRAVKRASNCLSRC